jgi:hypothetical protein
VSSGVIVEYAVVTSVLDVVKLTCLLVEIVSTVVLPIVDDSVVSSVPLVSSEVVDVGVSADVEVLASVVVVTKVVAMVLVVSVTVKLLVTFVGLVPVNFYFILIYYKVLIITHPPTKTNFEGGGVYWNPFVRRCSLSGVYF